MKIQHYLSLMAAGLIFSMGSIQAQPFFGPGDGPGGRHFDAEDRFERMADRLDLTDEQEKDGKAIHEKYSKQIEAIWEEISALQDTLREKLEAKIVDLKEVKAQLQKIAEKQVEMRMLVIQRHLEFEKILTDEQKEEWKAIMEKHRERMEKRMESKRR